MAGYYSATQQHKRRRSTGRLSHRRLQEATGLSRSAIFEALNRLEAAGILKRVQRLARRVINFGGMARLSTVQSSNLYSFFVPSPTAHLLPVRSRRRNPVARLVSALAKSFSFRAESAERTVTNLRGFQNRAASALSDRRAGIARAA